MERAFAFGYQLKIMPIDNHQISVLLIDDHQVVRDGLRYAFSHEGFNVLGQAATKAEAFAQIAHKDPQVVVVVLTLPDGRGLEVVACARLV